MSCTWVRLSTAKDFTASSALIRCCSKEAVVKRLRKIFILAIARSRTSDAIPR